jgi:3-methyl-2-oxobutanoate hydroxymethyltransferase
VPKHAKQYGQVGELIRKAVSGYFEEVKSGTFPTDKQGFTMDESILEELK